MKRLAALALMMTGSARETLRDRRGAVAIEYGLLLGMIIVALVGIATLSNVSESNINTYDTLSGAMD